MPDTIRTLIKAIAQKANLTDFVLAVKTINPQTRAIFYMTYDCKLNWLNRHELEELVTTPDIPDGVWHYKDNIIK
jgi:hypothetical protein